jgi:hypothetical protein
LTVKQNQLSPVINRRRIVGVNEIEPIFIGGYLSGGKAGDAGKGIASPGQFKTLV